MNVFENHSINKVMLHNSIDVHRQSKIVSALT